MRSIAVLFIVLATLQAQAQGVDSKGNDLANCVWANGSPMSADHCKQARREEQLWQEHKKDQEDQQKAIAASRKWQQDEEVKRKKLCGSDFGKLRIGMTMDRYEQCTEAVDYVTQTVTKDGVTETFLGTFYLINARDGRIISFTRRTN